MTSRNLSIWEAELGIVAPLSQHESRKPRSKVKTVYPAVANPGPCFLDQQLFVPPYEPTWLPPSGLTQHHTATEDTDGRNIWVGGSVHRPPGTSTKGKIAPASRRRTAKHGSDDEDTLEPVRRRKKRSAVCYGMKENIQDADNAGREQRASHHTTSRPQRQALMQVLPAVDSDKDCALQAEREDSISAQPSKEEDCNFPSQHRKTRTMSDVLRRAPAVSPIHRPITSWICSQPSSPDGPCHPECTKMVTKSRLGQFSAVQPQSSLPADDGEVMPWIISPPSSPDAICHLKCPQMIAKPDDARVQLGQFNAVQPQSSWPAQDPEPMVGRSVLSDQADLDLLDKPDQASVALERRLGGGEPHWGGTEVPSKQSSFPVASDRSATDWVDHNQLHPRKQSSFPAASSQSTLDQLDQNQLPHRSQGLEDQADKTQSNQNSFPPQPAGSQSKGAQLEWQRNSQRQSGSGRDQGYEIQVRSAAELYKRAQARVQPSLAKRACPTQDLTRFRSVFSQLPLCSQAGSARKRQAHDVFPPNRISHPDSRPASAQLPQSSSDQAETASRGPKDADVHLGPKIPHYKKHQPTEKLLEGLRRRDQFLRVLELREYKRLKASEVLNQQGSVLLASLLEHQANPSLTESDPKTSLQNCIQPMRIVRGSASSPQYLDVDVATSYGAEDSGRIWRSLTVQRKNLVKTPTILQRRVLRPL